MTVKEALTYWLESYAKEKRTDYESLKSRINKHIISQIGAMPLEKCELRHWLACFDQMAKRSPVSAGFCYRYANRRLSTAENDDTQSATFLMIWLSVMWEKAEVSERVLTNKELGELLRARMTKYSRHTTAP